MNCMCRGLARILSSSQSATTTKTRILGNHHLLTPLSLVMLQRQQQQSSSSYTTSTKTKTTPASTLNKQISSTSSSSAWPRPKEIPFQAKVANSVDLIGYLKMPVRFIASSDGRHWGVSLIAHHPSPSLFAFRIPIIFEGDLAHIAACHLKEKDYVYIAGHLTADPPPFNVMQDADPLPFNIFQGKAQIQVMVHSINFVQEASHIKQSFVCEQTDERPFNDSASMEKYDNSALNLWRDLLDNPKQWWDYRNSKLSGLVKPKYPDFKHKDGRLALWLDRAPGWVLSELEGLEFDVQIYKSKQVKQHKGDEFWKDLVENPAKWWDNRLNKKNVKAPDFKHKESGQALWLSGSPHWVLSKLPPLKSGQNVAINRNDTLLS